MTDPLSRLDDFISVLKGERDERRGDERIRSLRRCRLIYGEGATMRCFVVDLSESGARLRPEDAVSLPEQFDLQLEHNLTVQCKVIHRDDTELGVTFLF
ncbi:MAG: PilZ domain-containing protein [Alphaproteobacteria bacterium]|nr:PilZ domain-containing protein [Alphaproteobacteria bacterium]